MKKLHDLKEERWQFQALGVMDGIVRRNKHAREAILLLHGFGERGLHIYRKLIPWLPDNAFIIAPNGPFPLPRPKENKVAYGHSWYFYDRFEKQYFINQDLAKNWIREVMHLNELTELPLTIIGFSQGGYLSPLIGKEMQNTSLVIGIGCEFRNKLIEGPVDFRLEAVHGTNDGVIAMEMAMREVGQLRERGIQVGWHPIDGGGHDISKGVGEKVKEILEAHGKRSL